MEKKKGISNGNIFDLDPDGHELSLFGAENCGKKFEFQKRNSD